MEHRRSTRDIFLQCSLLSMKKINLTALSSKFVVVISVSTSRALVLLIKLLLKSVTWR